MEAQEKQIIRAARKKFVAMAATYSLGVFNDNFFKTAAVLVLVTQAQNWIPSLITALFALPFIFLAAPAGWMADRFSKKHVVIFSKILELIAMGFGAVGILTASLPLVCVMVIIMASQSTMFSPSLNGSIPELYPDYYVTRANAFMKVFVTISILLGTAMAGYALDIRKLAPDIPSLGRYVVAGGIIFIAMTGVIVSFFVPKRRAADPKAVFPWAGIVRTFVDIWELRKDRLLAIVVAINMYVWFVGSLQLLMVIELSKNYFKWSESITSTLLFFELIGVACGGLVASVITRGDKWYKVLPKSNIFMGVSMGLFVVAGLIEPVGLKFILFFLMFCAGLFGGIVLIPCESFIQVRPAPEKKGTVIASANCAAFIGILVSAGFTSLLLKVMSAIWCFAVVSGIIFLVGIWMYIILIFRAEKLDLQSSESVTE